MTDNVDSTTTGPVAVPAPQQRPGLSVVRARSNAGLLAVMIFIVLFVVGLATVSGFGTWTNIRSMLLFASFLGIAAIGQSLCALVGGLDLSIPYVIGAADIGFLWMTNKGLASVPAIVICLAIAVLVGLLNGGVSFRQPSQALIVTLGTGFAVEGAAQYITSSSTEVGGAISGSVPNWLQKTSSASGNVFGVGIAPSVVLWAVLGIGVMITLHATWVGRGVYAVGGNPVAARLARIRQGPMWLLVYAVSACMSAVAGILLLGFSGGAYADVGQPYLFSTIAAVVIGGTSLLGGRGGYGLTALGVAILSLLTTLLVGLGLSSAAQQVILGLVIIAMVTLYGRQAHPRTQI